MSDYTEEYLSDPDSSKMLSQLNRYYSEKEAMQMELEVAKASFANVLKNGLGQSMKEELRKPKRRSLFTGLKYRLLRFLTVRKELRKTGSVRLDVFEGNTNTFLY